MSQYDKLYSYLDDLNQNQIRLSGLLQDKLKAVESFDINRLDEIIKEEQVFVLVSKSFDTHMERFRQQLGLRGEKLSDILTELPPEEEQRFRDLHKRLQASLEETRLLNEKCQDMLEDRLYAINKKIKSMDKSQSTAYGKAQTAAKGAEGTHLFTKSI